MKVRLLSTDPIRAQVEIEPGNIVVAVWQPGGWWPIEGRKEGQLYPVPADFEFSDRTLRDLERLRKSAQEA